jgi:4-amino-4-deoxy-L-arabinose transferase-like glycosyltransferase
MNQPAYRRVLLIVAVFLITRLLILALYEPEIVWGDQLQYIRIANSNLDHGWLDYLNPDFELEAGSYYPYFKSSPSLPDGKFNPIFWDPLYPLFISVVYEFAGPSNEAVRIVQLLFSLFTLLLGMDVVGRMFPGSPRAREWFGWFFVAYLPFAGFVTKLFTETLDAFLFTLILWVIVRLQRSALLAFLALGALLGLYVSIKSYFVLLLPAVFALLWWVFWCTEPGSRAWRGQAARLLMVLAGIVVILAPTYIRNYNLTGGAALLSTKGSWNLWKDNNHFRIENHAWREQGVDVHKWLLHYYRLGSVDLIPTSLEGVYYDPQETNVRPPCDTDLDQLISCERENAIAFMLEDPLRFAKRAVEKNANLWSPNNFIFNRAPPGKWGWMQNYRIELSTPIRYLLQIWVIVCYVAAMLLFFVGITIPSGSGAHRIVRAFVALVLLYLVFVVVPWGHGENRYRLPYMVPILMFAVLGAQRGCAEFAQWVGSTSRPVGRVAILVALVALFAALSFSRLPALLAP